MFEILAKKIGGTEKFFFEKRAPSSKLMVKELVNKKGVVKVMAIITTCMWCLDLIWSVILYKRCFRIHTLIQYGKLIKRDPKINIVIHA